MLDGFSRAEYNHSEMSIHLIAAGFFGWVGFAAVIAAGIFVLLFAAAFTSAVLARRSQRMLFPRATLALLEFFFVPLRRVLRAVSGDEHAAEKLGVRIYNQIRASRYASVPLEQRMVFLPQCLRDNECPARLSSEEGFACKECGKCVICEIRRIAPEVRVFVNPGGSFSRRLLMRHRPKAVLGVACPPDLFEGLQAAGRAGIPAQGVSLSRTGCVNTDVSFDDVREKLLLGVGRSEMLQKA